MARKLHQSTRLNPKDPKDPKDPIISVGSAGSQHSGRQSVGSHYRLFLTAMSRVTPTWHPD
jgi:hypothetical protein